MVDKSYKSAFLTDSREINKFNVVRRNDASAKVFCARTVTTHYLNNLDMENIHSVFFFLSLSFINYTSTLAVTQIVQKKKKNLNHDRHLK